MAAAAGLLASGGRDALTTRAVAAAAGVQAPTIYRLFASGCGTVFTLLATPEAGRDPDLPAAAREAVIAAITTGSPTLASPGPAAAAIALRAVLPDATALTGGEHRLLEEWLDRLAAGRPAP